MPPNGKSRSQQLKDDKEKLKQLCEQKTKLLEAKRTLEEAISKEISTVDKRIGQMQHKIQTNVGTPARRPRILNNTRNTVNVSHNQANNSRD